MAIHESFASVLRIKALEAGDTDVVIEIDKITKGLKNSPQQDKIENMMSNYNLGVQIYIDIPMISKTGAIL